jgi:hypothetical protein
MLLTHTVFLPSLWRISTDSKVFPSEILLNNTFTVSLSVEAVCLTGRIVEKVTDFTRSSRTAFGHVVRSEKEDMQSR